MGGGCWATIVKPGRETFWGDSAGYLQDPNGHVWEIVWGPAIDVEG